MAPKFSKMSASEQAARLHQRAVEVQTNASIKEVNDILKRWRDLAESTLKHLESLGAREAGGSSTIEKPKPSKPLAISDAGSLESTPQTSELSEELPMAKKGRLSIQDPIPRCYNQVQLLPPQYLVYLLSQMEPISLSEGQLRTSLCAGRSRHIPKQPLLEMFTALTGLRPSDELSPNMRVVVVLVEWVCEQNVSRRRLLREVRLPVQWPKDGIYIFWVEKSSAKSIAICRVTGARKDVPKEFLRQVKDANKIYISNNHDQTAAQLVDGGGFARCNLVALFPEMMESIVWRSGVSSAASGSGHVDADEQERGGGGALGH